MGQQEIQIATIVDLIEALHNPQPVVRTATLQAIASQPGKASSLAAKGEVDLFQELAQRRTQPSEAGIRASYVNALLSLDDERGFAVAKTEFLATDNPDIVLLTAGKLAGLPAEERIEFFGSVAMVSANQNKRRVAANLLAHCRNLPVALAIRVAITTDHPSEIASLTEDNLAEWLQELQGPYPRKARHILLAEKDNSIAVLFAGWKKLPPSIRLWAFQSAVQEDPGKYVAHIRKVLSQEQDSALLKAALEALRYLPLTDADRELIAPFYRHSDPELRAVAVKIEQVDNDWALLLKTETVDLVRVEIISRLAHSESPEHLCLAATQLEDKNWRVRAAATAAMVAMAPASIPVLQKLFTYETPEVRAAATQALQKLGQYEWVAAQLL